MPKIHIQLKKLLKQYYSNNKTKLKLVEDLEISNVLFDKLLDPEKKAQPNKETHIRRMIDKLLK